HGPPRPAGPVVELAPGGQVGVVIWHETYVVGPGQYETVYVDMPRYGLGRAGRLVEAGGHRQSAEGRLRGGPADARPA
ncbi:DUF4188 domain-containing protein, partial [uncultured Deinococcus sp.]|uniref:monooxygenase family protein n=1 Tax=uncultured Deinococcus sp. TaxID=158789 RepID=UPI002582D8BE